MRVPNRYNQLEKAQFLPIVVIGMIVMIAFAALIIDGGAVMLNRRTAQAAADAGALAGAKRACQGNSDAKTVAENYATVQNDATSATATVSGKQVTVIASVEHPSFFAKIFGKQTLKATATATAGCLGVSGEGAVPVGWLCLKNNTGGPFDTAYGCQMQTLSWKLIGPLMDPNWNPPSERVTSVSISDYGGNTINYIKSGTSIVDSGTGKIPPNQIYIIMDGAKICSGFLCDFNKDGKNEINPEGNRGYLYLTTYNKTHTWLSGKGGTDKGFFKKEVGPFEGQVVMLPVYNYLCNGNPENDDLCLAGAHASPPWPIFNGVDDYSAIHNGNKVNYHIIAFAPFYVSCADDKGNCPGYIYARTKDNSLKSNEPILEGYFLTDVDVSIDSTENCAINLGNCTVSLTK